MRAVILILVVDHSGNHRRDRHRLPRHQPDPRRPGAAGFAQPTTASSAKGGQAPAFDVQTGSVTVGSKETTVKVPALEVQKPGRPGRKRRPTTPNSYSALLTWRGRLR